MTQRLRYTAEDERRFRAECEPDLCASCGNQFPVGQICSNCRPVHTGLLRICIGAVLATAAGIPFILWLQPPALATLVVGSLVPVVGMSIAAATG